MTRLENTHMYHQPARRFERGLDMRRVVEGRGRAAAFLLSHRVTAEDGAGVLFYGPMKGRVLDTALTLHILQRSGLERGWQAQLSGFLLDNLAAADLFSATVARAVLTRSLARRPPGDQAYSADLNRVLEGLRHARDRKKALLGTILAELSAIPFEIVDFDPALLAGQVAHSFSRIYFAAIKICRRRRQGASAADRSADLSLLLETQAENGSWEQQSLLTLVALMAIGPQHPAFVRGLAFLRAVTREDGGVAFCDNLNLWTTALSGLALLPGVELGGQAARDVAQYILSRQQSGGGWAFSERVLQADTDTTAQCAQFLLELDRDRYAQAIDAAHGYFASRQRPDGGYPTYELGGESESTMTANIVVVQAMSLDAHPDLRDRIDPALDFLCADQSSDGTYERSWSLSEVYSIYRVNLAFDACRLLVTSTAIERAQQRSVSYLVASQHADGGWGHTAASPSDALSTAYALLCPSLLRHRGAHGCVAAGLEYLLSQQDPETGEVVSIPDVAGPRPIVFNIPLLSTVFSVMALRALERV